MKILMIMILAAAMFSSCVTKKGAVNYMYNHPEVSSEFCAKVYPPVQTDSKEESIIVEGNNTDYSGKIDTLNDELNRAQDIIDSLTRIAPENCKPLIAEYQKQIASLRGQIRSLRNDYKPCEPTIKEITRTITVVDSALKDVVARFQEELNNEKEKAADRLKWIIGLSAALLVSGYFNVRKLLPV